MTGDDLAAVGHHDDLVRRGAEDGLSARRTAPRRRMSRPARILLLDDDPAFAELVTAILSGEGYRVWWAPTSAAARALLEAGRPDLVLLDLILPDCDGLLLCSDIRAQWPTPIVVLSGTARRAERALSLRAGANDFISKPVDPLELLARVGAVLRRAPMPVPPP